ncbi:HIT family hydrolase [Campylobacter concisus]|uniref:HIT family hydrolase n=1 Tax=Campylobacter concisus TaxID=199 RepID=UPI000CD87BB9|nr:HIT family hydrolase [Campylobacter concisus]
MTEQEALNELTAIVNGNEQAEPETNEVAEQPAEEAKTEPAVVSDEPKKEELNIDAIKQALTEALAAKEQSTQGVKPQLEPEKQALLDSLGLGNLDALKAQMDQITQTQAAQAEEARRQAVFDKNLAEFKKDYPTIRPDDLAEFAKAHGMSDLLGENYVGWKAVAMGMINVAKSKEKPDEILSGSNASSELSAFDRAKKGENVSDVEYGAELLKLAGL